MRLCAVRWADTASWQARRPPSPAHCLHLATDNAAGRILLLALQAAAELLAAHVAAGPNGLRLEAAAADTLVDSYRPRPTAASAAEDWMQYYGPAFLPSRCALTLGHNTRAAVCADPVSLAVGTLSPDIEPISANGRNTACSDSCEGRGSLTRVGHEEVPQDSLLASYFTFTLQTQSEES